MITIAHIHTDFKTKFGVPRQSGLVDGLEAKIVFEPQYRNADALRGLEGFSHIWLLWDFSEAHKAEGEWSPTVRPPRLGGNKRMGVFATRSPFRPNNIGLSSVRVSKIELNTPEGPVIYVEGADLMDGTPILDIKPYLPFTDCHPEATGGYTDQTRQQEPLEVEIPQEVARLFSEKQLRGLQQILASDPRPHYIQDNTRVYAMEYGIHEVKFTVDGNHLTVLVPEK